MTRWREALTYAGCCHGDRVRFRLGGTSFPPQIYYKIFTRAPLCDVGAFAPRVRRTPGTWEPQHTRSPSCVVRGRVQDYTRERGVTAAQRHNRPTAPPVEGHGPDDSGECGAVARVSARV